MSTINYDKLKEILLNGQIFGLSYQEIINWAIEHLEYDASEDIMILAGLYPDDKYEIEKYIRRILGEYPVFTQNKLEEVAAKIVINNGKKYFLSDLSIVEFERIIDKLYINLNYPDWLVILSRDAEYATDIDVFIKPFENELKYIIKLWTDYPRFDDFMKHYDRQKSNLNMI